MTSTHTYYQQSADGWRMISNWQSYPGEEVIASCDSSGTFSCVDTDPQGLINLTWTGANLGNIAGAQLHFKKIGKMVFCPMPHGVGAAGVGLMYSLPPGTVPPKYRPNGLFLSPIVILENALPILGYCQIHGDAMGATAGQIDILGYTAGNVAKGFPNATLWWPLA